MKIVSITIEESADGPDTKNITVNSETGSVGTVDITFPTTYDDFKVRIDGLLGAIKQSGTLVNPSG